MAKQNPYFKFYTGEWLNGRITLEDLETQGLFINLCAYYWHNEGKLSKHDALKRFKNPSGFELLLSENLIGLTDEMLVIDFLDEQLNVRGVNADKNRANGKRGGRPKKTHSVSGNNPTESGTKAEQKALRVKEEEKKSIEERKKEFGLMLAGFKETYSHEILKGFYTYWTEHSPNGKKMRFEKEKVFDPRLRLATWKTRERKKITQPAEIKAPNDYLYEPSNNQVSGMVEEPKN